MGGLLSVAFRRRCPRRWTARVVMALLWGVCVLTRPPRRVRAWPSSRWATTVLQARISY